MYPAITVGGGGGRSNTIVTASRAVCLPSGPEPTRHVCKINQKQVTYQMKEPAPFPCSILVLHFSFIVLNLVYDTNHYILTFPKFDYPDGYHVRV